MREECRECKKETFIVNRTRKLCNECNFKRLHGSKTMYEHSLERQKEYQKKEIQKKHKPLPSHTRKTQKRDESIALTKKRVIERAIVEDKLYCWGHGQGGVPLDCSHIISVRRSPGLADDEKNINLFCRDCHNNWESNNYERMSKLLTFESDMEYIKRHDEEMYFKIFLKKSC